MRTTFGAYHVAAAVLAVPLLSGCRSARFSCPDPGISIDDLEATVRYLSSLSPPRNYAHPESMRRAAAFVKQKLADYGFSPESQGFEVLGQTYENVVASVGPREGPRVIVGAHYDVCGDQPGADDNASGIAGLLEIARFAKKHENELPYRTEFVAYALEEPPFFGTRQMGSYAHARTLHEQGVGVRAMICLEMIGFFTTARWSQRYPLPLMWLCYPSRGDFIGVVGNYGSSSLVKEVATHLKATSVKVSTLKAPGGGPGVDFSDHRNYWKFGYEAVMITDTAFYRSPNYHRETDTIETLDFSKMREVVNGICWSVLNLK